jgi:hypothetical protein
MITKVNKMTDRSRKSILHKYSTLASNGSGNINSVVEVRDITNTDDYTSFTGHYDEYRIIGGTITLCCKLDKASTSDIGIAAIAFDNDDNTAPSSIVDVFKYASSDTFNIGSPKYVYTFTVPADNNNWIDVTAASTQVGGIKISSTGLAVSTTYLGYVLELLVEFRGRR